MDTDTGDQHRVEQVRGGQEQVSDQKESFATDAPSSVLTSDVTVIVPTLNESSTIDLLLSELLDRYPGIKIIIADDCSTDGTQQLVRDVSQRKGYAKDSEVHLLERENVADRGITASVLHALQYVSTEFVVVMDGDLQHPPEVVGDIICDFGTGSDFVAAARLPYRESQALHRKIVTWTATVFAKIRLYARRVYVADPMSGLFGGKTSLLKNLVNSNPDRFEPRGYKIMFDLLRLMDPSARITQVFYRFGVRPGGYSKLRPAHAFYFLRSLFK